ncbi:TatD family hydrolase [uncultured Treponema sp.]|uniref:TatD family hydrolase n=1 Tax=uncultured Treponema sp. TaxID=162155 RepID=UPI0025EE1C16|nr:TatD family hydrolase [uncultured Treponema sp.]MBQ7537659.1 TatD family hydrolase [Treponema sp.]
MFSDTHFHFHHLIERGLDGTEILAQLAQRNTFFGLDIGTRSDDLLRRHVQLQETVARLPEALRSSADQMLYYSAGIWPDVDEIKNRTEAMKKLEDSIEAFADKSHLAAIGECGIDHHWNPSGADGRSESDFDKSVYEGERELFQMQIELAQKMKLPVIVHSRDAFEDTLDCIKNMGYHCGIIHCYSYGKDEARAFLDLGWHIAFGGSTTYTKKAKMEEMNELLRFVPDDRLLMETDSPYLAPVPFRGQTNTPLLIEHCYHFVAQARGILASELSLLVDKNIRELFKI